jgi:hypothetical protein
MVFRDDYERKAHDILCIIKYGSIGGQARKEDIERVGDILRGHSLKSKVLVPKVPVAHDPKTPPVSISMPNITVRLPTIKLP